MSKALFRATKRFCVVLTFLGSFAFTTAQEQFVAGNGSSAVADQQSGNAVVPQRYPRRHSLPPSAIQYYTLMWGIDSLTVKSAESGEIIKFTYRVVDVEKAKILSDKKYEPSLIDPGAGVSLVIPSLEKVGKLRQSGTPQAGQVYWMAFSNKGRFVKPGHRVNVVIGNFRADGLIVQ